MSPHVNGSKFSSLYDCSKKVFFKCICPGQVLARLCLLITLNLSLRIKGLCWRFLEFNQEVRKTFLANTELGRLEVFLINALYSHNLSISYSTSFHIHTSRSTHTHILLSQYIRLCSQFNWIQIDVIFIPARNSNYRKNAFFKNDFTSIVI